MATIISFHCGRCGQVFSNKYNLVRHLKCIKTCPSKKEDIGREVLLTQLAAKPQHQHACKFGCGNTYVHRSNMYTHHNTCDLNPNKPKNKLQVLKVCNVQFCKKCGFTANDRTCLIQPVRCKKPCHPIVSNAPPHDQIDYMEQKLEQSTHPSIETISHEKDSIISALKLELQARKDRKHESFYQKLLEGHLGGTHKRLSIGETDVTTDTCHAEVKRWKCWKEALGQLMAYKCAEDKEHLQVYFFNNKYGRKEQATNVFKQFGIEVFEFVIVEDGYEIHCLSEPTTHVVYKGWDHKEITTGDSSILSL